MNELLVFSVYEVSMHLKQVVESQIEELYVRGEVSNFVRHSSGHIYFNLKDNNASMRCTFFKRSNASLNFDMQEGQEVVCFGKLTLYEKNSTYNLNVYNVSLSGKGDLSQRFEALKNKLKEEGLFDNVHKRVLPPYPSKIGIVTSPTGAALQDIKNILVRRFPVQVEVYPSQVQGTDAPQQLIAGIRYFDSRDDIDLVIITRGGGSQEDLWCFNDEALARVIFKSVHPIISAVGHEIDYSIADFVADLRAPTPSAAAELAVPDKAELMNYLSSLEDRIKLRLKVQFDKAKAEYTELAHGFALAHPEALLERMQQRLDMASTELEHLSLFTLTYSQSLQSAEKELLQRGVNLLRQIQEKRSSLDKNEASRLQMGADTIINKYKTALAQKEEILRLNSLQNLLKRGFAYVDSRKGHLRSTSQVELDDELYIHLSDGQLTASVTKIDKDTR
ncbi:MAG: exodeoxyribonuclease VII large subunit [Candidatus Cloacimonetes bacterium]|nr:exodeoxyribonuclease VII large subunit [Candidatus Cloacimonadota bacterium]NLO11390.1 exodeoxyribonuclease VII large subunit [Candidatus Cloacimonadota bacterium]